MKAFLEPFQQLGIYEELEKRLKKIDRYLEELGTY